MTELPDTRVDGGAPATVDEHEPATRHDTPIFPPPNPDTYSAAPRRAPRTVPVVTEQEEPQPSVSRERWVTRDELLSTSQHAIYGTRSPYARKRRRPLPQPRRFRQIPRWQSWTVLVLAASVSLVILFGAVRANPFGAKSHTPAATATSTVVHQPTATATAKPAKK